MFSKKEIVGVAGALVLMASSWFLFVKPEREKATGLEKELQALRRQSEEANRTLSEMEQAKRALVKTREQAALLDRRILKERDISRILGQLSQEAQRFGVRILSIKPVEETAQDPRALLKRLPVEVELKGRYLELGRFLEALANGPLLFTFEGLRLKRDGKESATLTLKAVAVAYAWQKGDF